MAPNNSIEYDADELEAPAWLDDEFFTKVMRNCETDAKDLHLNKLELFPATLKGDHYASVMFRAVVEYQCDGQDKTKRLIVKTMPFEDGNKKDVFEESIIFETEIGMYTQVLPRFEQILRDVGDDTILRAPILFHELSPRKIIIFEDIVPLGYEVLRGRYANAEEIKQSYVKLAKWHAISYKINIEEPGYFDEYHIGIFSMPNLEGNLLVTHGIDALIQQLETMPAMRKYLPFIQSIQGKLYEGTKRTAKEYFDAPKEDAIYVLCHGDFHDKNMMFKRDPNSGKLLDVMLLDFQLSFVGPLVSDLIYSYFLMLDSEQRGDFEQWLYFYYTHFKETLQKIGFEGRIPSLLQLHEQRWQHRYFELFLLMTYLPAWTTIRRGEADLEGAFTSNAVHKQLYADEEFLEEFEKLMRKYLHLGYFEEN
ncbi:uncharacterized protein LOC126767832 [Bactrocera neohumeralis]|uniref:uncharacterized protein LOC126767832 n=1 Tax=Bactrocera neohumeralis TaxID=98809 RepID=UPI002165197A|nr:uncharacterized protein LOC126767832 [Bactrocera neohumeralis]XP_050341457.1 uncharacterized protein LOC126767832 [Bactrocera neohumeralis]XP_050341458.1 uncharacterized protein LOC126767832 [Bactrocera neohumeralis]